ncbi:hypothetical protein ACFL5F_00435 [Planctomycetota bacterium]
MEHLTKIISSIAWPVVVLVIVILLLKPIRSLIPRIIKLMFRSKDIEFSLNVKPHDIEKISASKTEQKSEDLTKEAKKILATLWKGQMRYYKDVSKGISEGQWSFRILPLAHKYIDFIIGFAELLRLGLVGWTRNDGQAVFTKKGIEYVNEHDDIKESDDIYKT